MSSNTPFPGKKQFDERGNFVGLWKLRSDELYDAATVVWNTQAKAFGQYPDGKIEQIIVGSRPALLLMGLCLETLLKGLLVGRDSQLIQGGKIDNRLLTHNLERLFADAKISLTDSREEDLVKRLSASVTWLSKYPIPTSAGGTDAPSPDWGTNLHWCDDDYDKFVVLRDRIQNEYKGINYVRILRPGEKSA